MTHHIFRMLWTTHLAGGQKTRKLSLGPSSWGVVKGWSFYTYSFTICFSPLKKVKHCTIPSKKSTNKLMQRNDLGHLPGHSCEVCHNRGARHPQCTLPLEASRSLNIVSNVGKMPNVQSCQNALKYISNSNTKYIQIFDLHSETWDSYLFSAFAVREIFWLGTASPGNRNPSIESRSRYREEFTKTGQIAECKSLTNSPWPNLGEYTIADHYRTKTQLRSFPLRTWHLSVGFSPQRGHVTCFISLRQRMGQVTSSYYIWAETLQQILQAVAVADAMFFLLFCVGFPSGPGD